MIKVYVDGSCRANGSANAVGGWAFAIVREDELVYAARGMVVGTTNNQMELEAVKRAIKWIRTGTDLRNEQVEIYTDSAYIANCYKQNWYRAWETNGWVNSKKEPVANREQWECLVPFFKRSNIEIIKVKGHANNFGNQVVDKLAVAARTMDSFKFSEYRQNLQKEVNEIFKEDLF